MAARHVLARIALMAAMAALASCSPAKRDPAERDPAKRDPAERDPAKRDRPDPAACETAADCAPGPLVDPANVCCDTGLHLGVFSRAYLDWRARTLAADCKAAACPPLPPPTPPRPCATEPRCVSHRCTGSCEP